MKEADIEQVFYVNNFSNLEELHKSANDYIARCRKEGQIAIPKISKKGITVSVYFKQKHKSNDDELER